MNAFHDLTQRLARWLVALPRTAQIGLGAAVITLLAVAGLWMREPAYQTLFSQLEDRDGGAIVAVLNQRNIPYRFTDEGATILVPADQVYRTRLELAEQGLPRGGNTGFELLDEPKFGASQFTEQITYQRALEGELARSIEAMHAVRSARVHLAIPRETLFVRDREPPRASVMLTLYPARNLSDSQVSAISWLVSSSVPKLDPQAVSIVDQNGQLLTTPEGEAGAESSRQTFTRELEQRTAQRILALIAPIVGPGNVRAQVSATIDFSHKEQTSEVYRPNEQPGSAAIRSKQTLNAADQGDALARGVPGALSNEAPQSATAPLQNPPAAGAPQAAEPGTMAPDGPAGAGSGPGSPAQSLRNEATINYEVDRTISHVRQVPGTVQRLSVAVVLNYREQDGQRAALSSEEMDNINALVKQAMGYSAERGDTISVVNSVFADSEPQLAPWNDPYYRQLALIVLKVLLGLIVLFVLWRTIGRAILQTLALAQMERTRQAAHEEHQRTRQEDKDAQSSAINRYEENLETARQLAKSDPRAVAMVLRSWMSSSNARS